MSADVVIRSEELSKRYLIGHKAVDSKATLRDSIVRGAAGLVRTVFDAAKRQQRPSNEIEEFWALRNVSFDICRGDVVGVIGRNGAGKSTLLKVLSRITEPSHGRIAIKGRVASLLEVGTGFHAELTGRENIFLNGAILGMSRSEIRARFDEIVEFSGVARFLDTPVKRYSSGMYVRLAFAVAAHLDPEILIVDEVLAVGDAEFQKKCLGKMNAVAAGGRTVIFVSHNMRSIQDLCQKAIFLDQGSVAKYADVRSTVALYHASYQNTSNSTDLSTLSRKQGGGTHRLVRIGLFDADGTEISKGRTGDTTEIRVHLNGPADARRSTGRLSISIHDLNENVLAIFDSEVALGGLSDMHSQMEFRCRLPKLPFGAGQYLVSLFLLVDGEVVDWIDGGWSFEVQEGVYFVGHRNMPDGWEGKVAILDQQWFTQQLGDDS